MLDHAVEIVSIRCAASSAPGEVRLERTAATAWRDGHFFDDGGRFDATVRGRMPIGLPDATLLVASGWEARALPIGGWALEKRA